MSGRVRTAPPAGSVVSPQDHGAGGTPEDDASAFDECWFR